MPVSKTVDQGSNPCGPAGANKNISSKLLEIFLFSTCPAARAASAGTGAMFSFSPKKENREVGSQTLSRICAKCIIILSDL